MLSEKFLFFQEVLKSQYTMSAHKFLIYMVWFAPDESENIYVPSATEGKGMSFAECFVQRSLRVCKFPTLKMRV